MLLAINPWFHDTPALPGSPRPCPAATDGPDPALGQGSLGQGGRLCSGFPFQLTVRQPPPGGPSSWHCRALGLCSYRVETELALQRAYDGASEGLSEASGNFYPMQSPVTHSQKAHCLISHPSGDSQVEVMCGYKVDAWMQILAVGTLGTLSCLSASLPPSVKWGES